MYPELFRVGPISIHSYGVMMALAFLVGIWLAQRRARAMGVEPQLILDISVYLLVGSLVGARLLYVFSDWANYRDDLLAIAKIWEGGLAYQGGVVGGLLAGMWFLRIRQLSPWKVADVLVPSVALGQAFGRIGCFLNGCCFGKPTRLPWGITFPAGSFADSYYGGACRIHPTELYASLNSFLLFLFLIFWSRRRKFDGQLFWLYGLLYGITRFAQEFLRADNPYLYHGITLYHLISLLYILISLIMLRVLSRKPV